MPEQADEHIKTKEYLQNIQDTGSHSGMPHSDDLKAMLSDPTKKALAIERIAIELINEYHVKTVGESKRAEIYVYKDGYYQIVGERFLKSFLEKYLREAASTHILHTIIEKVKNKTSTEIEEFSKISKELINVKNGILNIKTKTLIDHCPSYLFLHQFPVKYNSSCHAPKITKFINDTFPSEEIDVVYEMIGSLLYRKVVAKKAFILVGPANTGKSTMINLITDFVGERAVACVSLHSLCNDKFASSRLFGMHASVFDDLEEKDIRNVGRFKVITGNGWIDGQKKFGDSFDFKNYATPIMSCNTIPSVKAIQDNAFFGRLIIFHCENVVTKKDSRLEEELTADNELSGLLNKALNGLNTVLKNEKYSYSLTTDDEIRMEMMQSTASGSIAKFIRDRLVTEMGSFVSKDMMYKAYSDYCTDNEIAPETKVMFGRKLIQLGTKLKIQDYSQNFVQTSGKKERGWKNIRIKHESDIGKYWSE